MDGMNDFGNKSTTGSTPGSVPPDPAYTAGYGTGPATGVPPQDPYGVPYPPPPGYVPHVPGAPNPGLATLLGFIPGVGAMYNGQFAKGIAHIAIFAVFVSLADHVDGIFGMLVAGWLAYMVFDAYQTARARRDGMQIPDPFGLNNIGERFGLGHGPNWNDFVARSAATGTPTGTPADPAQPYTAATGQATYPSQDYVYDPATTGAAYQAPPNAYYAPPAYGAVPPAGVPPYGSMYPGPPSPVPPPAFDPALASRSGLPSGAIWLIGLGVLALLSSLGHTYYFRGRFFAGSLLIFIGAVLIFQQLRRSRRLYPEGSAAARWYAVNSSRGAVFLIPIGIFMLLDAGGVARWHYTWPYLFILLGVYQIASRTAYNRMIAETPSPYAESTDPTRPVYTTPPPAQSSTSIVPTITPRDEEGR